MLCGRVTEQCILLMEINMHARIALSAEALEREAGRSAPNVKTRRPRYGRANACATRFRSCSSKSVQYSAPWDGRWLKVMAA